MSFLIPSSMYSSSQPRYVAPPEKFVFVQQPNAVTVQPPVEEKASGEKEESQNPGMVVDMLGAKGRKMRSGRRLGKNEAKLTRAKLYSLEKPYFPKVVPNENVYRFTQMVTGQATVTSSTTVSVFTSINFTASTVDQISNLTAIFDQYKIECIEVFDSPRVGAQVSGAGGDQGNYASVIDYDDSSNLASFTAALDYQNVMYSSGRDCHYRKFVPHIAVGAYSGSFSSFANQPAQWIDAVSTGVQHYGYKSVWTATDAVYTRTVLARLHMAWRNIR